MKPLDKLALKVNLDKLAEVDMAKLKPCKMDFTRMEKIRANNTSSWSPFKVTDPVPSGMVMECQRQADKIKDVCKCIRRALAAEEIIGEKAAEVFYSRARELLKGGEFNVGAYVDKR